MRRTRILGAAAAAAALLTATAASGTAGAAATNGVGTSKASTTVLNVALGNSGSRLNVRLRGVNVPSIQVLNLGAVLQGLGVNPANLSVGQVGNALDALQTKVVSGSGLINGTQLTALSGLQQVLFTPPVSLLPTTTAFSAL